MRNDRYVNVCSLADVPVGIGTAFIDGSATTCSLMSGIELVGSHTLASSGSAEEMTTVMLPTVAGQLFDKVKITTYLITITIEYERRMIAIFFQDSLLFTTEEVPTGRFARFSVFPPHGQFHL